MTAILSICRARWWTNPTDRVLDDEIPVVELGIERILDQFVISMILALVRESDPQRGQRYKSPRATTSRRHAYRIGAYPETLTIWLVECVVLASDTISRSPRSAPTRQHVITAPQPQS